MFRTLTGHTGNLLCLEKIGDYLLASGSNDFTVKLWNVLTGENFLNFTAHTNYVETLKYLDNDLLASGARDQTVKIWSTKNGSLIKSLSFNSMIFSLQKISPNLLLVGAYSIFVYDLQTYAQASCSSLDGHTGYVYGMKLIFGKYFASVSEDKSIKFWDLNSCGLVKSNDMAHGSYIFGIELIDNSTLASVSDDNQIGLWDISGNDIKKLGVHGSRVNSIVNVDDPVEGKKLFFLVNYVETFV